MVRIGRPLRIFAVLGFTGVAATGSQTASDGSYPPPFITYSFRAAEGEAVTWTDTGKTSQELSGRVSKADDCPNGVDISSGDTFNDVAIARTLYQGNCWTSTGYSHGNYLVEYSTVGSYNAYRVYGPSSRATNFDAGQAVLYLKFPTQEAYTFFELSSGSLVKKATIDASGVTAGTWVKSGIFVDGMANDTSITFVLLPASTMLPDAASRTIVGTEVTACMSDKIWDAGSLRDVAVLTDASSSGTCWTDSRYTSTNYQVERGVFVGSDGSQYSAYRFHPPTTRATEFVASKSMLYFRSWVAGNYTVASYDGQEFSTEATLTDLMVGEFNNTGIRLDQLTSAKVLVFVPVERRLSIYPVVSDTVDGAWLGGNTDFSLSARRFDITGHAFIPGTDWGSGPGSHSGNYGIPKKFYSISRADGKESVLWQDQTSKAVYLTWFAENLTSAETALAYSGTEHLISVASNGDDKIALFLIGATAPATKTDSNTVKLVLISSTSNPSVLLEKTPDTSKSGLDVYAFSNPGASMKWNTATGVLGVVLARTMTQASDGLNHQGAIAVAFNATTLEVIRNHGQTSGHSFANSLILTSDGNFLVMDLGDNYPRGINLQRFNEQSGSKRGGLVYAFKTRHGTSPNSPAGATYPEYTEISTAQQTFYKWSNDNYVYTELGHEGVVEVDDGLLVFFSGEQPPLDSTLTGEVLNVARNVAFVKIAKDLSSITVLSSGATETGGFYTFGGSWSSQSNQGINFITSFNSVEESASRLKTAKINSTSILLYWEVWTRTAYRYSQAMIVDTSGSTQAVPWAMSNVTMRLPIQDDLSMRDGRIISYAGAPNKLVRYELCTNNCPAVPADPPQQQPYNASLELTLPSGVDCASIQNILDDSTSRTALEAGLAESLAGALRVDDSQVRITQLEGCQARLRRRRLQTASLGIHYAVAGTSSDPQVAQFTTSILSSSSLENARFLNSLAPSLTKKASAAGSSLLTTFANALAQNSPAVGAIASPTTTDGPTTTLTTTATDGANSAVTMTTSTTTSAEGDGDTTVADGAVTGGPTSTALGSAGSLTTTTVTTSATATITEQLAPFTGSLGMTMPAGVDCAALDQVLGNAAARTAFENGLAKAIATALGIDVGLVSVTDLQPCQAARLRRRLSEAATLNVDFEIAGSAASDPQFGTTLSNIAEPTSTEGSSFASSLAPALTEAATTSGSSALASIASQVETSGVTVTTVVQVTTTSVEAATTMAATTMASTSSATTEKTPSVNAASRFLPHGLLLIAMAWVLL